MMSTNIQHFTEFRRLAAKWMPSNLVGLSKIECDVKFAFSLATLASSAGSGMPNYSSVYGHEDFLAPKIYPNSFLFAVGESGSGKSALEIGEIVLKKIDDCLADEYKAEMAAYDPSNNLPAPRPKSILVAVDTTHSALVRDIADRPDGSLISAAESDSFKKSLAGEHGGGMEPFLRTSYEHRCYRKRTVKDNISIKIETPRVGLLVSGTMDQFKRIFTDDALQNGLFGRFQFFCMPSSPLSLTVRVKRLNKKIEYIEMYDELGSLLLRRFLQLRATGMTVFFTEDHLTAFELRFQNLADKYVPADSFYRGLVTRMTIAAWRYAMTLHLFVSDQKFTEKISDKAVYLALHLTGFLFQNTVNLYETLQQTRTKILVGPFEILNKLTDTFTTADYCRALVETGGSYDTGKTHHLPRLIKLGEIEKISHGTYKKTDAEEEKKE